MGSDAPEAVEALVSTFERGKKVFEWLTSMPRIYSVDDLQTETLLALATRTTEHMP